MRSPPLVPADIPKPTDDEIAAAPTLDCWLLQRQTSPAGTTGQRLLGYVSGHPVLPDGWTETAGVVAVDDQGAWALTLAGLYRLLKPAVDAQKGAIAAIVDDKRVHAYGPEGELDALPRLEAWFLHEDLSDGLAYTAHGWLSGHPTISDCIHTTDLVMGFDFDHHRWLQTRDGEFYRLGRALFNVQPPRVYIHRLPE
jgi:hypothetical protein